MPLLIPLLFAGGGALAGFTIGGGADDLSKAVKWAVIGGVVYVGAKAGGVIK